ncbi:MAG: cysteine--tRNA ligase [Desulfobacterales bacterium]
MKDTILDVIGHTPLVAIRKLNPNPRVRLLAKLEYFNPGGSIKDRVALSMIEAGERSGELTPEKTVLEATSGNTGIGLALVCAVKSYRLVLAMSEAVSVERRKILQARGAEILLTPGHLGTDGAIEEVYRLARENPELYFLPDQFNNPANWHAHYYGTAAEIIEQTGGNLDMLVATMGTTGTLMGMYRRFKEYNPRIRVVGVEPYLGHKLQGLKNMKEAYSPEIFDKRQLDRKINIEDEKAFTMMRRLVREEGLFCGMSSGAAMAVAADLAQEMESGTLVVILPDGGERYLSTPVFDLPKPLPALKLYDTPRRAKVTFEPLIPGQVNIYSCGPTAHRAMHVGECRRMVFSDLLVRYFTFRGLRVSHVMNITDLDDKTIDGSARAGMDLSEFTEQNITAFHRDLEALGIRPADAYPLATKHIPEMVRLAEALLAKGFAYEKLRSLYFNIGKFPDYGRLSGVDIKKIKLGATVDLDEYEKDNPRDFTLFKRIRLSDLKRGIFAKTPWGNLRPSWHIQCAAIAMEHLGPHFDIFTGGRELLFPHHENQNAIAQVLHGEPLARYWLHCERVLAEGKKMSDGDDLGLAALKAAGYSPREIRYWLLAGHYRKPLAYSLDRLELARKALQRLDTCIWGLQAMAGGSAYPEIDQLGYDLKHGFTAAMDDDFNIAAALANLFKLVRRINRLVLQSALDRADAERLLELFRAIDGVLGVMEFDPVARDEDMVAALVAERHEARNNQEWARADALREKLLALGVAVRDDKLSD